MILLSRILFDFLYLPKTLVYLYSVKENINFFKQRNISTKRDEWDACLFSKNFIHVEIIIDSQITSKNSKDWIQFLIELNT